MLIRVWVAALVACLSPGSAFARGTKMLVVVRSAESESAVVGKAFSLALGRAVHESTRYEWVDLDVLAGGPEMEHAQRELDAARRKARRGREALLRLEVRDAAQLLREAIDTYKENAAYLTDVSELSQALMHLGAILLHANKKSAARKLLAEAVTMEPSIETDPQVFNPPMRKIFDDVKKRIVATRGSLTVASTPSGALAVIDGRVAGLTPVTVHDLHQGRHVVRVLDDGLVSWGAMIDVTADTETRADASLALPKELPDLAGQIGDAYRLVARGGNAAAHVAAAHVADLGRSLGVEQVLLARVRRHEDRYRVVAGLYGVAYSVRLAGVQRELPSRGRMDRQARDLLAALEPPELAILVGSLRVPGRAELSRNIKRTVTELIGKHGGTVSFLSTPMTHPCLNDPTCVREGAASLNADGVVELEVKRSGGRLRIRARCLDGHSGKSLWSDQLTTPADGLRDSEAMLATIARIVDSAWETHANVAGTPADTTAEIDTVTWDPTPEVDTDPLHAPVPEESEPIGWDRILGWTTVSVGMAAAIGGTVLAFERNAVLSDPASSGDEKTSARRTGLFAIGAAAVGVGVAALGGWLTWDSYQD